MINHKAKFLASFNELVDLKFQLYNGLFLTLPFEDMTRTGSKLQLFSQYCTDKLDKHKSPKDIIESFFAKHSDINDTESIIPHLFKMLQFIERQVVLFDALEDAAFPHIQPFEGVGTLSHFIARIQDEQKTEQFISTLKDYKIRIVLTAHPTQFYPDSVLGILSDLTDSVACNDQKSVRDLLLQMGKTRFRNKEKPTPLNEAKSLMWYLENVFYECIPNILNTLSPYLSSQSAHHQIMSSPVELGFWPGGDRDGNPFVTFDITRKVSRTLHLSIVNLYLSDIKKLKRRLSFDGVYERLEEMQDKLEANINASHHSTVPPYVSADELLKDAIKLQNIILESHKGLFLDEINLFICKVIAFGFHFASIDMRQDSRILNQVFEDLVKSTRGSFRASVPFSLSEYHKSETDQKIKLIQKIFHKKAKHKLYEKYDLKPITVETIKSIEALKHIQDENGERAIHRYIISNTQSYLNLFELMGIMHLSGYDLESLKVDIVPLFETVADLKNAADIMTCLYTNPLYKDHLTSRNKTQYIMVGFSDGTKDGGYITANWSIYKAKKELTELTRACGFNVVFFDGRGGPPARGGGNTHKFYQSLGSCVEQKQIHLTIQGQTVSSNFGTQKMAKYNLEQLFTAGLETPLFKETNTDFTEDQINLLETLSSIAYEHYQNFKSHPLFLPYLEKMTPLNYYNQLTVGSRPARRKQSADLQFEDLRAIPFVGAWSQMKQNIAGYYGLGKSLSYFKEEGRLQEIIDFFKTSLYFRTLLTNSMQSLMKSHFQLTSYIKHDKVFGGFWELIHAEYQRSVDILKEISGEYYLLDDEPVVRKSILLREQIILPLLTIQQYALIKLRELSQQGQEDQHKELVKNLNQLVLKSIPANINAARNAV